MNSFDQADARAPEMASRAGLATIWAIAGWARLSLLPHRIPLHFGWDDKPDAWGSANQIFLMPAIALGLYAVITLVVRFPQSFHYGVKVTEENRARLQATAIRMMGWMKAVFLWVMTGLVALQVMAAREGTGAGIGIAALLSSCLMLGTVAWVIIALKRAA